MGVATQKKIINLIRDLNNECGTTVMLISHDLNVVRETCNRVIVMKDGKIVEEGKTEDVFGYPSCEYTKQLISFM